MSQEKQPTNESYQSVEFDQMEDSFKQIAANTITEIETVVNRAEQQFNIAIQTLRQAVILKQSIIKTLDGDENPIEYLSAEQIQDAARQGLLGTVAKDHEAKRR